MLRYFTAWMTIFAPGIVSAFEIEFAEDSWTTNGVHAGEYVSNAPEGWSFESNYNSFKLLSNRLGVKGTNITALAFDCSSSPKGKTGELKMDSVGDLFIPHEEIVCDNIVVDLMLYVQPVENLAIDELQVIATTNDWADTILVDRAIPIDRKSVV